MSSCAVPAPPTLAAPATSAAMASMRCCCSASCACSAATCACSSPRRFTTAARFWRSDCTRKQGREAQERAGPGNLHAWPTCEPGTGTGWCGLWAAAWQTTVGGKGWCNTAFISQSRVHIMEQYGCQGVQPGSIACAAPPSLGSCPSAGLPYRFTFPKPALPLQLKPTPTACTRPPYARTFRLANSGALRTQVSVHP